MSSYNKNMFYQIDMSMFLIKKTKIRGDKKQIINRINSDSWSFYCIIQYRVLS